MSDVCLPKCESYVGKWTSFERLTPPLQCDGFTRAPIHSRVVQLYDSSAFYAVLHIRDNYCNQPENVANPSNCQLAVRGNMSGLEGALVCYSNTCWMSDVNGICWFPRQKPTPPPPRENSAQEWSQPASRITLTRAPLFNDVPPAYNDTEMRKPHTRNSLSASALVLNLIPTGKGSDQWQSPSLPGHITVCHIHQASGLNIFCSLNFPSFHTSSLALSPLYWRNPFSIRITSKSTGQCLILVCSPKVLEKVVANHLISHINSSNKSNHYQSANRKLHSIETALLNINSDILSLDAA